MKKIICLAFLLLIACGINRNTNQATANSFIPVEDQGEELFRDFFNNLRGGGRAPDGNFEVLSYREDFGDVGKHDSLRHYVVENVLNSILSFLGLVAVAAIIYSGFLYITAGGDDTKTENAKKIILFAAVGILVILLSFALVNTIIQYAGRGEEDPSIVPDQTPFNELIPNSSRPVITNRPPSSLLWEEGTLIFHGGNDLGANTRWIDINQNLGLSYTNPGTVIFPDGTRQQYITGRQVQFSSTNERWHTIRKIDQVGNGDFQPGPEGRVFVGGVEADFSITPASPEVNQQVILDASRSTSGPGTISNYTWDCLGGIGCDPGRRTNVVYNRSGNYSVTLTITTSFGVQKQRTYNINVRDLINVERDDISIGS